MKLFAVAILALVAIVTATVSESEMPDIAALNALANLDQLSTTTRMGRKCKDVTPILVTACSCYVLKKLIPAFPEGLLKNTIKRSLRQCLRAVRPLSPRRACRKLKFKTDDPRKALRRLGKFVKKCFGDPLKNSFIDKL